MKILLTFPITIIIKNYYLIYLIKQGWPKKSQKKKLSLKLEILELQSLQNIIKKASETRQKKKLQRLTNNLQRTERVFLQRWQRFHQSIFRLTFLSTHPFSCVFIVLNHSHSFGVKSCLEGMEAKIREILR